jgi:hypothetical protein
MDRQISKTNDNTQTERPREINDDNNQTGRPCEISSTSVSNFDASPSTTLSQSYISRYIHGRRNRRELRHTLYPFRFTNDQFTNQIFNGTRNFF